MAHVIEFVPASYDIDPVLDRFRFDLNGTLALGAYEVVMVRVRFTFPVDGLSAGGDEGVDVTIRRQGLKVSVNGG